MDPLKDLRKNYDIKSVNLKLDALAEEIRTPLRFIRQCPYDTEVLRGNIENLIGFAHVPIGLVGPVNVSGNAAQGLFHVPMATTEGAMVLTYDLGARLLKGTPITVETKKKVIHISPMFILEQPSDADRLHDYLTERSSHIKSVAEAGSSHTVLLGIDEERLGDMLLMRFRYDTGDAHGLNMINQATFQACIDIEANTGVRFHHRSHYSWVKHHSPLNESIGYGFHVKASVTIPASALRLLRVDARRLHDFNHRCIEAGSHAGIRAVNVHAANGIAAIYLACGQDMADLSSSHVCRDNCVVNDDGSLYWEIDIPNLLVATVGGGTSLGSQQECLRIMKCYGSGTAQKFAEIIAATTLAGEFPTAAAVVNRSYVDVHNSYGRNKTPKMNCKPEGSGYVASRRP